MVHLACGQEHHANVNGLSPLAPTLGATASAVRVGQTGGGDPPIGLPLATGIANTHVVGGRAPEPTTPPGDAVTPGPLTRGSDSGGISNAWLNEHTCGWLAGASSFPWTCAPGATCATDAEHAVACVSGDYAPFFTVCLDFEAYRRGDCSSVGPRTGCCHTSSVGQCGTYLWVDGPPRSMFRCFAEATIISLRDRPQFVIDASATGTSNTTPSPSSVTYTTATEATATDVEGGGDGAHRHAHHVGAAVGGAVGAVAVLALAAGLFAYLVVGNKLSLRAKFARKTTADSAAPSGTPAAGPPAQSPWGEEDSQKMPNSVGVPKPAPGLAI